MPVVWEEIAMNPPEPEPPGDDTSEMPAILTDDLNGRSDHQGDDGTSWWMKAGGGGPGN
jgi:hypothetical protein